MKKITCLGEFLLRMSPEMPATWINTANIPVYPGGAEFNVAAALANWGNDVKYITALPNHSIAEDLLQMMDKMNIDTSSIVRSGNRIGIYFLPQGADLKNVGVIYDRAGSSFASLEPGSINWNEFLADCSILHFSAISPALNEQAARVCREAVEAAVSLGLTISVDLNYRNKLWKYGKEPVEIMPQLVQHCTIVMGNIWSAASLLGAPLDENLVRNGTKEDYLQLARESAGFIRKLAPSCRWVANTFRFDQNGGIAYYASLDDGTEQVVSKEWSVSEIIDRVGSGDCFMAGLLHGWNHADSLSTTVNRAAAAAIGKLQEKGDFTRQTLTSIHQKIADHG